MSELEDLCEKYHLTMVELLEGEEPRAEWEPIYIFDENDELTKLKCQELGIDLKKKIK